MMTETLIEQFKELRLHGMAAALERQGTDELTEAMTFAERVGLMIQNELAERASHRLQKRLRWARLPLHNACLEDLSRQAPRGLDPVTFATVRDLTWIKKHLNVLITGPCGVGKSYLTSALAHAACRSDYLVRGYRLPRLAEEFTRAHALQRRSTLLKQLARTDVLLLDDFGLATLSDQHKRDLLEILDDRYDQRSTIITSQLPVEDWHAYLGDPTLADAILDRLVHNAYRLTLKGDSMRKRRAVDLEARPAAH
jgi:DNA replication protein DnaC